jgi:hypothetical protein
MDDVQKACSVVAVNPGVLSKGMCAVMCDIVDVDRGHETTASDSFHQRF